MKNSILNIVKGDFFGEITQNAKTLIIRFKKLIIDKLFLIKPKVILVINTTSFVATFIIVVDTYLDCECGENFDLCQKGIEKYNLHAQM